MIKRPNTNAQRMKRHKGKGIKYVDEVIIRKEGKAGKGKK